MARKRITYVRKPWETTKPGTDKKEPYAALYVTMLVSNAWVNLSDEAKALYVVLKSQLKDTRNRELQGEDGEKPRFYFNRSKAERLGYTNPNKVKRCIDELIDQGFIKLEQSGWNTRTKSIYSFSDEWQKKELKPKKVMPKRKNS